MIPFSHASFAPLFHPPPNSSSTTAADDDKQDRRLQRLMEAKQVDEDQDSDEEFEDRLQRHRRIMGPEIVHSQVCTFVMFCRCLEIRPAN